MEKSVTTWDGDKFEQMPEKKALELEEADKIQILRDGFIDGLALRYRHQFTGYKTRELRAKKPKAEAPKAEAPKAEAPKAEAPKAKSRKKAKKKTKKAAKKSAK